jgi:hypothetical protein
MLSFTSQLLAPLRHLLTQLLQFSLQLLQLFSRCLPRCLSSRNRLTPLLQFALQRANSAVPLGQLVLLHTPGIEQLIRPPTGSRPLVVAAVDRGLGQFSLELQIQVRIKQLGCRLKEAIEQQGLQGP